MIEVREVTKDYQKTTVLGPVNLRIPSGGITALVGPNGAGKSTMLTIAGRLLAQDSGTVSVGGHGVSNTPSKKMATVLSILRQENHFVTRLSVRELVGFGRFPHSQGRLKPTDHQHIDSALELLDLSALQDRFVDQLSGGQRQRAYVAMVLAQDTDYVLLDEPLNNLDMQHSVQMMQRLRHACDTLGKTFVIVLHDINFASAYADHIVALGEGKVVHEGSPGELMREDILSEIFHTPVTVLPGPHGPLAVYYR